MAEGDGSFPITRLSVLRLAIGADGDARQRALGVLWQAYWKPLYACARRLGRSNEAGKDLAQAFCVHSIEADLLSKFDPAKGRLRTWLLVCFRSFVGDEKYKEQAEKRGGGEAPMC